MQSLTTSVFGLVYLPRRFYLEIFEGDTASANALICHPRPPSEATSTPAPRYIKRLLPTKFNEVLEIIMKADLTLSVVVTGGIAYHR